MKAPPPTNNSDRRLLRAFLFAALVVVLSIGARAADEDELETAQNLTIPELRGVCCVTISGDGRFAYSSSAAIGVVAIFKRDPETGQLALVDTLKAPQVRGPIRVRISRDDKYVAIADSHANAAAIFKRDAASGALTKVTEVSASPNEKTGLSEPTDANLSPDNHFLYTASDGGLGVFKFEENSLSFVQCEQGENSLQGLRPFVLSPNGHWLYAVAESSGTLDVFRRDETSGELENVQMLADGKDGIISLRGAYRVAVSDDGRQVYVSAGRNLGDQAISSFEVQADGKLKLLQQFMNGVDDFGEFEGGNEIQTSPDGKWVFAAASKSDRLFYFRRNPEDGRLTFVSSEQAGTFIPSGAAGVCFSPDSKFAYVADQSENSIEIFKLH